MRVQHLYAALAVLGTVVPLSQFLPWLLEHGPNASLLLQQALAERLSAFAWADVVVSALTVIAFVRVEGERLDMRGTWLPLVGTLAVGPSLGLPLFLWMRERRRTPA